MFEMSDTIKPVIRNYISVQISSFWLSYLEGWTSFDLFAPHLSLGCLKTGLKINDTIKLLMQNYEELILETFILVLIVYGI